MMNYELNPLSAVNLTRIRWLNDSSLSSFVVRESDVAILEALLNFQVTSIQQDTCASPSSAAHISIANGSYSMCVMPGTFSVVAPGG